MGESYRVIPGRSEATSPESITTIGSMDFRARANPHHADADAQNC
jgi:hypothetical protein